MSGTSTTGSLDSEDTPNPENTPNHATIDNTVTARDGVSRGSGYAGKIQIWVEGLFGSNFGACVVATAKLFVLLVTGLYAYVL